MQHINNVSCWFEQFKEKVCHRIKPTGIHVISKENEEMIDNHAFEAKETNSSVFFGAWNSRIKNL
jgi:hypothetical protein